MMKVRNLMNNRIIDKRVNKSLHLFIETYKKNLNLTPETSYLYYEFIIQSYHTKRENRYSISMLSNVLKLEGLEVKLLINIYAHSLYILALNDNKNIYGEGFCI